MPLQSRTELAQYLATVPPPANGYVRVYRGQARGFTNAQSGRPSLLPALVRPQSAGVYDAAWLISVQMYINRQLALGNDLPGEVMHVWAPALLQHYGPGSRFLDVTASVDMALWFALHEHHETWIALPTRASPHFAMERWFLMAWHSEVGAESGSLPIFYVLDAPVWEGAGVPAHGGLVDVRALPFGKQLADTAMRLVRQDALLMYAGEASEGGPDLGSRVVAAVELAPGFEDESVRARTVAEVFPGPAQDPFYNALLGVPALRRFQPSRMEHALSVPCYLNGRERVWESKDVAIVSGNGERLSPLRMKFPAEHKEIAGLDEAGEYVAAGTSMEPPFLHPYLLNEAQNIAGEGFAGSLPMLLEAPVMTFLPAVGGPIGRAAWLESTLPLHIAEELDGEATADVYLECSPLDVWYPGGSGEDTINVLAARVIKDGNVYRTIAFFRSSEGIFSHTEEFRFDVASGRFGAEKTAPEGLEFLQLLTLKALFTALTVLRDASPGWKPPAVFSMIMELAEGQFECLPGTLMEPSLAVLERVAETPYRLVRSRTGGVYARASGQDGRAGKPADPMLELAALSTFAKESREPSYAVLVNLALAQKRAERGDVDEACAGAAAAVEAAGKMRASGMRTMFEAQAQILHGRALFLAKQPKEAKAALERGAACLRELESAAPSAPGGAAEGLNWIRALAKVEVTASAADVASLIRKLGLDA